MNYIIQLSFLFIILILFHVLNIYYYFQFDKYFNKSSEVYEYCYELFRTNEQIWQNVQVCNILVFIGFAFAFDYFHSPPDFLLNINNWICFIIILLEYRNIWSIDNFLKNRDKI